jgi:cytochrome c oxidase subunit 4
MAHDATAHDASGANGGAAHKPTSVATYTIVLGALLACTALTVLLSFVEMRHEFHIVIGLMIATVKASLVLVVFMHLAAVDRVNALVAAGGLFWLAILLLLTFVDYANRPDPIEMPNGTTIQRDR